MFVMSAAVGVTNYLLRYLHSSSAADRAYAVVHLFVAGAVYPDAVCGG